MDSRWALRTLYGTATPVQYRMRPVRGVFVTKPLSLSDRARGVIVGLACGDALGAPVEFQSRQAIAERYPDGLREFTGGGWMNVAPGELTDDSRMMIDLAETLMQPGTVDMHALGLRHHQGHQEQSTHSLGHQF
jgi:ADP-ribosylglycohydrolase